MDYILCSILLSFSLSLDSLGIGASYGIKKIRIPFLSMLTMSLITFLFSYLSVSIGRFLNVYFSGKALQILSFILLTSLAISMLIPSKNKSKSESENSECTTIFSMFIKWAGITITIIKEPIKGDMNNSEVIEFKEALCIGAALSLDALCACMGFFKEETNILLPLLIAIFQFSFMYIGEKLGKCTSHISALCERIISYIPPLILFAIAVGRLFVNA